MIIIDISDLVTYKNDEFRVAFEDVSQTYSFCLHPSIHCILLALVYPWCRVLDSANPIGSWSSRDRMAVAAHVHWCIHDKMAEDHVVIFFDYLGFPTRCRCLLLVLQGYQTPWVTARLWEKITDLSAAFFKFVMPSMLRHSRNQRFKITFVLYIHLSLVSPWLGLQ